MIKRLLKGWVVAIVMLLVMASSALAIINPVPPPAFYCVGSVPVYKVFYNVLETNDRLFVAEQFVYYPVTPNETASEAFIFEVLNTSGNETLASVPLKQYGAKPISIYLSAVQTANLTLTVGDPLIIRIMGNPLMFPSPTGNSVNITLGADSYVNQLLGDDGGVATDNFLRNFLIGLAEDLEAYDSPPVGSEYLITVSGVQYLTLIGGSIFLEGIPALDAMCPIIFFAATSPMSGDKPESTGAYASTLTPLAKWGKTTADGLTNLGVYLGINQALAGSIMLLVLVSGFAFYIYSKTQSGIAVLLLIGSTPFIGAWFGLMPLALAFIFFIVIVVLLGFFFLSRGAL